MVRGFCDHQQGIPDTKYPPVYFNLVVIHQALIQSTVLSFYLLKENRSCLKNLYTYKIPHHATPLQLLRKEESRLRISAILRENPPEKTPVADNSFMRRSAVDGWASKSSYSVKFCNSGLTMAIVYRNYPAVLLTAQEMALLQTELENLILKEVDFTVYSKFQGCFHKPG